MIASRTSSSNLTNNFTSLNLAISKLIDKQEKDWGYFQVKKEEEFYSLHLPFLPCLRLYQNTASNIYKAYWSNPKDSVPDLKDKTKSPQIYIKKKTQKVYAPQQPRLQKKQKTYEVIYQYDSRTEIHLISKIVANAIRDKIEQSVSNVSQDEIMPLVMVREEI
ncbi:MAG: hypothetical protein QNJ41_19090 [Xenococcaceae cyanobacterium MO_188.B32]|nr:hypothetical protein [Xenococcaceae cyanobacterium MO_188.B32]